VFVLDGRVVPRASGHWARDVAVGPGLEADHSMAAVRSCVSAAGGARFSAGRWPLRRLYGLRGRGYKPARQREVDPTSLVATEMAWS